jgi:hypothetical protein
MGVQLEFPLLKSRIYKSLPNGVFDGSEMAGKRQAIFSPPNFNRKWPIKLNKPLNFIGSFF